MLRWCANLSMLFRELPFPQRFQAARQAGFQAVEFWWPGEELQAVSAAREASGLAVAMHNMDAGDMAAGERGFASRPDRRDWWRVRAELGLELAARLGCRRMNVLAGNRLPDLPPEEMKECLVENLRQLLPAAREAGVTLLLEPLNPRENPRYLLPTVGDAVEILEAVGEDGLALQLDLYHAAHTEGDLVEAIGTHFGHIGHLQLADYPGRHQPGTGQVRWRRVLGELERRAYGGYVGLEYTPLGSTEESLGWLPREKRGSCAVEELQL